MQRIILYLFGLIALGACQRPKTCISTLPQVCQLQNSYGYDFLVSAPDCLKSLTSYLEIDVLTKAYGCFQFSVSSNTVETGAQFVQCLNFMILCPAGLNGTTSACPTASMSYVTMCPNTTTTSTSWQSPTTRIVTSTTTTVTTTRISTSTTTRLTTSVRSTPTAPAIVMNFRYMDCYSEGQGTRALTGKTKYDTAMTAEMCAALCTGYTFMGTEYGSECYCGNSLMGGSAPVADGRCSMTCGGSPATICGGPNGLSLYRFAPQNNTSTSSQTGTLSTSPVMTTNSGTYISTISTNTATSSTSQPTFPPGPSLCANEITERSYDPYKAFDICPGYARVWYDLHDPNSYSTASANISTCRDYCASNSRCMTFVYRSPGNEAPGCWLKGILADTMAPPNDASGFTGLAAGPGPVNYDFPGCPPEQRFSLHSTQNWLICRGIVNLQTAQQVPNLNATSYEDCSAQCGAVQDCQGWVYQTNTSSCSLKLLPETFDITSRGWPQQHSVGTLRTRFDQIPY